MKAIRFYILYTLTIINIITAAYALAENDCVAFAISIFAVVVCSMSF